MLCLISHSTGPACLKSCYAFYMDNSNLTMKRLALKVIILTVLILLVPLLLMQFTAEVNWDLVDFLVMAALLSCAITTYLIITQKHPNGKIKIALVVLICFLVVWVELAVGLFSSLFI